MILVAPDESSNSWFPVMMPWIQGEPLQIPELEDALTQVNCLIRERP